MKKLRALLDECMKTSFLALLGVVAFIIAATAQAEESFIDSDGYKYVFKESIWADGSKLVAIETFAPGSSKLLAKIPGIPPDSCTDSPLGGIKKLPTNPGVTYIAICRNDVGRSQTLYIMMHGKLISEIFFDSSTPNLTWDKKLGAFVAEAYPMYLNNEGSLSPFLVLYVWDPLVALDRNAHVTFSQAASGYYFSYYKTVKTEIAKNTASSKYLFTSLVAALASTSSSDLICQETRKPPLSALPKDQLKDFFVFIAQYGFPFFDLTQCNFGE